MQTEELHALYERLRDTFHGNEGSDEISNLLAEIGTGSVGVLSSIASKTPLISKVAGKEYFWFETEKKTSRAVNASLFVDNANRLSAFVDALKAMDFSAYDSQEKTSLTYTLTIGFCCVIDLIKSGDQKTPGTYFEYIVGHICSRLFNTVPRKRLSVLQLDEGQGEGRQKTLPTDFVFDLGTNKPKLHVPVKTSTRERVIQVWAHQRVLDGVYGMGRILGLLACLSESKTGKKTREVTEICLPWQWRLYQMFIAQMHRVYYLDLPAAYAALKDTFPKIVVKPFGDLFTESNELVS